MTNYVWYPVTGDGQSLVTAYTWNGAPANWNTGSWAVADALIFGSHSVVAGAVPGSGTGNSSGPGLDSVGLIAGAINSFYFGLYTPDPVHGDPFIASNNYPVDLTINSGTVDINSLLLAGVNQAANSPFSSGTPLLPIIDVEGAAFKIEGSILNSGTATFPAIVVSVFGFPVTIGGTVAATGGGTIDIGNGGTVQVNGTVQSSIIMDFKDSLSDLLNLGGVSSVQPNAFGGAIVGFGTGDTILLSNVPFSANSTESFNAGTLTVSNGGTTLAALSLTGSYTTSSFSLTNEGGKTAVTMGSSVGGSTTAANVDQVYQGILRQHTTPANAQLLATQVNGDAFPLFGSADSDVTSVEGKLLNDPFGYGGTAGNGLLTDTGDNVSIPVLTLYLNAFGGATNAAGFNIGAGGLTFLSNFSANVLVPGGFSLQNIYVNEGAAWLAGGALPNYTQLHNDTRDQALTTMYHEVFGVDPTQAQLSGWDGAIMDFYASYAKTEDGARGAMFGIFQYVADLGTYAPGGAGGSGVHGALYQAAKTALDNAAHGLGPYASLT